MLDVISQALPPLPTSQTNLYFQNWEYSLSQAQRPLTLTITLIAFLALVALGLHLRRKWTSREGNWLAVIDPVEIRTILGQAVQERATFDTSFQGEWAQRTHFSCAPLDLDAGRKIILETPAFTPPQPAWIGRRVTCHFRIGSARSDVKWLFYHFSTVITDIQSYDTRETIIINVPQKLQRGQRRAHLRLEPFTQDVPSLRLWPETLAMVDVFEEEPPTASFLHTRRDNHLHVLNISAGGVLLEIRATQRQLPDDILEKGKRFYLSIALRDPENDAVRDFHLKAKIRNLFTDPHEGKRLAGFSFTAYRIKPGDDPNNWVSLDGKGVEAIDDWVFKRHLQIYREKGLI